MTNAVKLNTNKDVILECKNIEQTEIHFLNNANLVQSTIKNTKWICVH